MIMRRMIHFKCRNTKYPFSDIQRFPVDDNQVPWSVSLQNYEPIDYSSEILKNKPWADPDIAASNFNPQWNKLDGSINRQSYEGIYDIVQNRPLNPWGRTGVQGRGVLGRWGPNHAADPIVTRWKLSDEGRIKDPTTNLPILQFCAIQRRDNNEWAIPGGMVDHGETISETLKREFQEEALNALEAGKEQCEKDKELIENSFENGTEVYKGYCDDPRNTDNAWMETVAYNFHDETGNSLGKFSLIAGDDARNVQWMDIDKKLALYASHVEFIKTVSTLRNAHW